MKRPLTALAACCVVLSLAPITIVTAARRPKPPTPPASPSPPNGATGVNTLPTLTWTSNFATGYDVYFGTGTPLTRVAIAQTTPSYAPPQPLAHGTTYYWQIVAINSAGATPAATWSFATVAAPPPPPPPPQPPGVPGSPSPADAATNVETSPTLTWSAAGAASYDVYFGTTTPPPLVSPGRTNASY